MGFDSLRDSGAAGAGMKIAVIDTFVNPDAPELAGANLQVRGTTCVDPDSGEPHQIVSDDPDQAAHGTNVVSMLVGNGVAGDGGLGARGIAPEAEVWFYGVGDLDQAGSDQCKLQDPTVEEGGIDLAHDITWSGRKVENNTSGLGDSTALAARAAIRDGADVVSVSVLAGGPTDWDQVIFESLIAEVPIFVGVLNPDDLFALQGGPYMHNGAFAINAIEEDGSLLTDRETGMTSGASGTIAVAAPGGRLLGVGDDEGWGPRLISGTSYATPLAAGAAALGMQKYPDASPFQVTQAMLRTTGSGGVHEIEWGLDELGAGYLNVMEMLKADPSQFPDENPQWVTSLDDPRCEQDGKPGYIADNGQVMCGWSASPFVEGYEKYRAAYVDGEPIAPFGELEATPYTTQPLDEEPAQVAESAGVSPLMVALAVVGVLVLLGGIAVAIVLVVVSRKRRRNREQTTTY
ncbi:S8/S53 family peptidase [Leucobacter chromiiresistens]|nr:S8/S53 family peptidase [Leucobacter chromiiresistens]